MASFSRITDSDDSINPGQRWCPRLLELLGSLTSEIMEEIHNVEQFIIKLHSIYGFICQISFFVLCLRHFENSPDRTEVRSERNAVMALTTVLFYSVFGYFATRIRDIYQGNRPRSVSNRSPSLSNYLKWLCKIVLEWGKAVVVVLCLKEQGIQYEPNLAYSLVTFIYYLCTEKIFIDVLPQVVEALNIDKLDNLEHLYVPLFMNSLAIGAGLLVGVCTLYQDYSNFILLSLYFMVYLRVKDAYYNYWELLVTEKEAYASFQVATKKDIDDWDDICAVCLSTMSKARITPCNHLFHPYCLKQCLRNSFYCPLCKQHFMETNRALK